jgi:hypothetical protein
LITGSVEAPSEHSLIKGLLKEQYCILEIKEIKSSGSNSDYLPPISLRDLAFISRMLATMLSAGLPVIRALAIIQDQTRNNKVKKLLSQITIDIERGYALHEALRRHPKCFSSVYVNLIKAGEQGGVLVKVLKRLGEYLEEEIQTKNRIITACIYPALILVFTIITGVLIIVFVMPTFAELLDAVGADAVFKYYIYLADDQDKLEPWLSSLKSQGFQILSRRSDRSKERPNKSIKELDQERSKILVLECWEAETGLKQTLAELEKLESAHLSPDLLLGQVTLIASTQMAWSDIVGLIPSPGSQPKSFAMSMTTGQMYRTALAHHVYYACQPQDFDSSTLHLFNQGLPLIEAGYLELRMISRLLRERSRMVEQELRDLDQQLSRILHTHLVTEQKESNQAEELEEQIQALSSAYGMLATDMNLINEGRRRLQRKWERFQTRLGRERALVIDDDQLGILGQPFLDTLDNLNELSQTLITTRDSHQAAINVVRSRIDIMNSRTNIATQDKIRELMELNTAIQKQGLAFQLAAGLIEFIVLAYYSHSLWKNLVHNAYDNIPAVYQFIAVLLFSSLTTYLTHLLAEYVQGHTQLRKRIILTGLPLLLLLLIILLASIVFNSPGVVH